MTEQRHQSNEMFKMHTPNQRGIEEARRIMAIISECNDAILNEIGNCQDMHEVTRLLGEAGMYARRASCRRKGNQEE